ncbi:peptidase family m13 protein [Rutstroemia sp. NJR-2017a BBW]|nr:peptidase family m13 protein [Rutstroemia sp. NJR-2017a BBW]
MGAPKGGWEERKHSSLTDQVLNICTTSARLTDDEESDRTPLLCKAKRGSRSRRRKFVIFRRFAESIAIVILALVLTALVVLFCMFFTVYSSKKPTTKATTCQTPACIHASSQILYNLSPDYKKIDACSNFEELVCGGWRDLHDLRPDQGDAFTGTIMSENSQTLLRHILEGEYPGESKHSYFSPMKLQSNVASLDQENFEKLKAGYNACMNETAIKNVGIKPLVEIMHQVLDFFSPASNEHPILQKEDHDNLTNTILYMTKLESSALISLGAGPDDKNPDAVVIQVSSPYRIGLPSKEYYKDEKVVASYINTIAQILPKFQAASENRLAENVASDLVDFEKKLAAASPDAEDMEDVTKYYNPMSLDDASKLAPQIQLSKIVRSLVPADVEVDRLIVASPSYMKALAEVLDSTSKETLEAYFKWKLIQSFASAIKADELKPYTRFMNELQGKDPDSEPERWRTCVSHVDDGLGWILSRFFVEKSFSAEAKDFGDQIVSDIKDVFVDKLKATTWMDQSVVKLGIEKVHKIVQKIGYPTKSPDIMDPPTLFNYYQSVKVSPTDFFSNTLNMRRFDVAHEWSSVGRPVDRDAWGMTVPTVNAYYNPPGNEIVFPAGIMQFPVFDVNVPQYISYGAFGAVSGHELSHAFDSTGRHYDQNGNFTDWWTPETVAAFEKRADCFVDQYANYTIPGTDDKPLHVNGRLTLGENIADAGGLSAAFQAWKKREAEHANEDLPGLGDFTQDQLFFGRSSEKGLYGSTCSEMGEGFGDDG